MSSRFEVLASVGPWLILYYHKLVDWDESLGEMLHTKDRIIGDSRCVLEEDGVVMVANITAYEWKVLRHVHNVVQNKACS